jgi:hypothetical protein
MGDFPEQMDEFDGWGGFADNGTFKTRTEAETGMKTMKVCTEN